MSKLRLAMLQLDLVENNRELNQQKLRTYALQIAAAKPDLIIIPELALEGYDFSYAQSFSQEDFASIRMFYADLARELKSHLVAGIVEKEGDQYYDSALCLNKRGEEISLYRKFHLWGKEAEFFTPGSEYKLIEINNWQIGIGICADAGFPEFARSLVLQGADLLLYISAWVKPYADSWILMCQARACENQVYTAGLNRIGKAAGAQYCGHSIIAEPSGEIVRDFQEREEAFVVELDKDKVLQKRKEIPWLAMRRPELYLLGAGD